jgi:ribosomal protein L21
MQVLLKKVLLLGSRTKTIVGRPFVANASVTATVEAQVSLDMEPSIGPAAV